MAGAHTGRRSLDGGHRLTVPLAEIELVDQDGVRIVSVAGELDISNVGALEDATFGLSNDALGIVVDLSSATYIDSATLGLLFRLQHSLKRRGQTLRVVCPPGSSARRRSRTIATPRSRQFAAKCRCVIEGPTRLH
jgi:anti-anti-sigma factor